MSDPVDLSRLRRTSAGDREVELELLQIFVDQSDEKLKTAAAKLAAGDYAALAEDAHSMKGSAANVGADQLREVAASLEAGMKSGETDRAEEWVADLEAEYARVRRFIEEYRAKK